MNEGGRLAGREPTQLAAAAKVRRPRLKLVQIVQKGNDKGKWKAKEGNGKEGMMNEVSSAGARHNSSTFLPAGLFANAKDVCAKIANLASAKSDCLCLCLCL